MTEVLPLADHTEAELLSRAAGLEAHTDHPLARAIVEHARSRNIPLAVVSDFQVFPGKGAQGRIDGRDYWLGSHRYLEERAQESPELHEALEQRSASGQTVVVVGSDDHVCGLIALADAIRPESADAIRQLKALGIKPVVMLTGDNRPTAEAIAAHAGIDEVRAELLPEDKVSVVADLVERHGMTAMVGDGINDAPALARASIGIAMGVAGSDAAIETADIALLADDLRKIPLADPTLSPRVGDYSAKHFTVARGQGGVRRPHVRWSRVAVGGDCRGYGCDVGGGRQRFAATS